MDDPEKLRDRDRQKLLEEIRKRAEEAELKRIEEEERKAHVASVPPPPAPSPSPPPAPPPPAAVPPAHRKMKELREKFQIAVDKRKLDRAQELLDEMKAVMPDAPELEDAADRLRDIRHELQEEARAKKRAAEQKAREEAAQERARREQQQRKLTELFEKAYSYYQSEKYEKGLETLREIFAVDADHEKAKQLQVDIEKAKELAERVRQEEERRKAQEGAVAPVAEEVGKGPQTPAEVWGSKDVTSQQSEFELPPVSTAPPVPKVPVMEKVVEKVSRIRIPVKPVLITLGTLVFAGLAYVVIDNLRSAVFPPKYSLLVFPALGVGGDSTSQFLAQAATEDLIQTLSVVADLRVVASATAFSLSARAGNLAQSARSVGANWYLEWTISRLPDGIGFQATLLDTLSSRPVWSTQVRSSSRELQSSLRELARRIVREMEVDIQPGEEASFARVSATVLAAYEAYARGRWYLRQGDPFALSEAIRSFSEAVEIDTQFVDARLALGWSHLLAAERDADAATAHVGRAVAQANRVLPGGVRTPESYRVRGLIAQFQGYYERAVDELERGAEFAPSDAETHRRLAVANMMTGKSDEAVKAAVQAVTDDPRNVDSHELLGMLLYLRDDFAAALQSYEVGLRYASDKSAYASGTYSDMLEYNNQPDRALQILADRAAQTQHFADYYRLGRLYQTAGYPKERWEAMLERAHMALLQTLAADSSDAAAYAFLGLVHTRRGAFKDALGAAERALRLAPGDVDVLYTVARMYALQNDEKAALEYLGKAIGRHYRLSSIIDMDFYNLRTKPAFLQTITQ